MTAATIRRDEATAHLPVPRRALTSRLSAGHVVMVVAGLLGFLLTLDLLQAADTTVPVAVAAADIEAGERVDAGSFDLVDLHAAGSVLDTLVAADRIDSIEGGWRGGARAG
ncbi:MAG: hypothetical protein M5T61_12085 [Acidimicrobiia bacterium]|nr:hypothetical protein [Acidimicrobiia bacterium]